MTWSAGQGTRFSQTNTAGAVTHFEAGLDGTERKGKPNHRAWRRLERLGAAARVLLRRCRGMPLSPLFRLEQRAQVLGCVGWQSTAGGRSVRGFACVYDRRPDVSAILFSAAYECRRSSLSTDPPTACRATPAFCPCPLSR